MSELPEPESESELPEPELDNSPSCRTACTDPCTRSFKFNLSYADSALLSDDLAVSYRPSTHGSLLITSSSVITQRKASVCTFTSS